MKKLVCKGTFVSKNADTFRRLIVSKGVRLNRYQNNAVILFNHDDDTPIGNATKVTKHTDTSDVAFEVWDSQCPPSVYAGIKNGTIKGLSARIARLATSNAFVAPQGVDDYIPNSELLEISVCSIPRNADCVINSVSEVEVKEDGNG